MLTRSDKTVANRYVYDDYGAFRSRTEGTTNYYAFSGREYDPAVDLIFYRARYYDPLIGRFLTRDPAGMVDGANIYVYAGNNPITRIDPRGTTHCGGWEWWTNFWGCLRCDACAGYVYMISVIGFMQAPESYGDLVVALIEAANWICGILFGLTGIGFFVCLGVVLTFVFILAAVVVYYLADIFRDPYKPCRAVGLCP